MFAIESNALSKVYRSGVFRRQEVGALREFSIQVETGQIFSLLGPNGAGKTTFIKMLLSLASPTSGTASVLGVRLPDVRVRHKVGYLPENHRYPGYLTAEQVLRYFGALGGAPAASIPGRVEELLNLVGLAQWRKMKVKRYSKGMMQRLGLAQALMNDPEVIFLDEPTDGVDPVGRKEIREILRDLKIRGKTVFLNSHLLSEVELVSDRVAVLDKGRLLKVGTVEELTATGQSYVIGISGSLPEPVIVAAQAFLMGLSQQGETVTAECRTTAELNRVIDLLRKNGVEITSVTKQRSTLEDSFISLIAREAQP
ncbi:MAG TPA: ABC transporter ATP-binding protein [Bacteroidota bacterium]|nr:ABC transporter ATP-binding protein [Bacteroidota bacterium]